MSAAVALRAAAPNMLRADPLGRAPGIQLCSVAADLRKDAPGTLNALNKIGYCAKYKKLRRVLKCANDETSQKDSGDTSPEEPGK